MIHIDGHALLALIVIPSFAIWLVGYVNYRLRMSARRKAIASQQLREAADEYEALARITRSAPSARLKRAALNNVVTDLRSRAKVLDGGVR